MIEFTAFYQFQQLLPPLLGGFKDAEEILCELGDTLDRQAPLDHGVHLFLELLETDILIGELIYLLFAMLSPCLDFPFTQVIILFGVAPRLLEDTQNQNSLPPPYSLINCMPFDYLGELHSVAFRQKVTEQ